MGGWNWRYTAKLSDRICKSEKGKKLKTENWKKKYKEPFRPFSPLFCQTKFLVRVGQMIFIILYFIFGITNSLYILKDVEGSISSSSSPLEKRNTPISFMYRWNSASSTFENESPSAYWKTSNYTHNPTF